MPSLRVVTIVALIFALIFAGATACEGSFGPADNSVADRSAADGDDRYTTPSMTCSDGPRWPRGTQFEYERGGPIDAPACTPHCGPNKSPSSMWSGARGALTSDALPSGACAENGVVCTMSAEWLGPCPEGAEAIGPLDLFICRCASGAWACTIDATSPSATSNSCRLPDGTIVAPGTDGGRE